MENLNFLRDTEGKAVQATVKDRHHQIHKSFNLQGLKGRYSKISISYFIPIVNKTTGTPKKITRIVFSNISTICCDLDNSLESRLHM